MSSLVAIPDVKHIGRLASMRRTLAPPPQRSLSVAIYLHDLSGGGVERQSLIIAEEFRREGVDVTLVLHSLRGQLREQVPAGLRVVNLNGRRTLDDIPRLARFLRRCQPDILLTNLDLNNIAALMAKAFSFSPTKVVICQHNPIAGNFVACQGGLYRLVGKAYHALSPLVSQAVAVSSGVAQELRTLAGLPADRVTTINNPVVGPDFEFRAQEDLRHPWFGQPSQPVFVTAGRLVALKDHATMIEALALHRRNHDSRLIVLGVGPLEDDLKALAAAHGLADVVDFVGFHKNTLPFFRQADAFLLSSLCEGFGNVLIEAMGCGTPVISTDCDYGPAEILDNGRYGLLVAPRSAQAMAAAMDQVSTLRQRFPADLLKERANMFSYATCASRYMTLFMSLAPQRAMVAQP